MQRILQISRHGKDVRSRFDMIQIRSLGLNCIGRIRLRVTALETGHTIPQRPIGRPIYASLNANFREPTSPTIGFHVTKILLIL